MRLINTHSLELVEFIESDIPNYAVLSHTWNSDEVSLHEFVAGVSPRPQAQGYLKVVSFCAVCLKHGIEWAWADTCCIDKSNGAELSEAINSMFRFYKSSSICVAYLSDVPAPQSTPWNQDDISNFQKSKWFTRGWTLQELLAPKRVVFYSSCWTLIGEKNLLTDIISTATGIDENYIRAPKNVGLACVAQKMSWMSKRQTTREEDMAYCLLGLFRVNMPLLYGERGRAFLRLQEEILKVSADHTIFAWFAGVEVFPDGASVFRDCTSGLLAPSPSFFAASHNVRRRVRDFARDRPFLDLGSPKPYQMTNKGLQIEFPFSTGMCGTIQCAEEFKRCRMGILNCHLKGSSGRSIAIYIRPQQFNMYSDGELWQVSDGDFERLHLDQMVTVDYDTLRECRLEAICVRRGIPANLSITKASHST